MKKQLLFAGTELGVFFSTNDGDLWQPLRLNMPVTPVHDLVIKNNDLVVATHGRSFWILDDISPLRQLDLQVIGSARFLFTPATAMRIRANTNHDTPIPAEEPAGENPPPGAIFYYYLKLQAQKEVKLEVLNGSGQVVRSYSSKDQPFHPPSPPAFPEYWFKPAAPLSAAAGMHRFVWDIRYSTPPVAQPGYSMSTAAGNDTPREPEGPQALAGPYQIRLTVDGQIYIQRFKLEMDPRVKASAQDLEKQFALELKLTQAVQKTNQAVEEIHAAAQSGKISAEDERKLAGARRRGDAETESEPASPAFAQLIGNLSQLITTIDSADAAPTKQESEAADKTLTQLNKLLRQWTLKK